FPAGRRPSILSSRIKPGRARCSVDGNLIGCTCPMKPKKPSAPVVKPSFLKTHWLGIAVPFTAYSAWALWRYTSVFLSINLDAFFNALSPDGLPFPSPAVLLLYLRAAATYGILMMEAAALGWAALRFLEDEESSAFARALLSCAAGLAFLSAIATALAFL